MQAKVRNALIFAAFSYCACIALGSGVDARFAIGGVAFPWAAGAYALNVSEREDQSPLVAESSLMRAAKDAELAPASDGTDALAASPEVAPDAATDDAAQVAMSVAATES